MKGAVIYARFSCEKQNEQSIEGQLRICNQYAQANGLTVLDTYIDRAMTGRNDQRVAFQQMLSDCTKPVPWDIVLVYAIDRFGRNSIEIAVNKQKLKKNHKTLISATQRTSENIDGSKNLDGILLENMYIGLAEYYSAELSQKVIRGMYEGRKKGNFCGGTVPYGYRVENKRLLIDENQAEVIRYIYQQYANGKVAREIIDDLTARGILFHGKPLAINTLYRMIRSEKYIGINRHGEEVYTNRYPPIVSESLFYQVQAILAKNTTGSASRHADFMLKGKLYCGYCGHKMNGESGTSHMGNIVYYYKCCGRKKHLTECQKSTVKKDNIENYVVGVTLALLRSPENISIIADEILKVHEIKQHDQSVMNLLNDEYAQTQKSLSNVMKAIEEGIITPTTKTRMEELEAKLKEIEMKIQIEQYSMQNKMTKQDIVEYLTHMVATSPQAMIYSLIRKIVLYDDKIEIYYNYTDNADPDATFSVDNRRELFYSLSSTLSNSCSPKRSVSNRVRSLSHSARDFSFCSSVVG